MQNKMLHYALIMLNIDNLFKNLKNEGNLKIFLKESYLF